MGFTAKSKSRSTENWGMGFFLVFFPEETTSPSTSTSAASPTTTATDKSNFVSSPSSSSPVRFIRRSNSSNPIIIKAQSTISICALFVFLTLLLFTLSTFEPTTSATIISSRRFLSLKIPITNKTNQFPSFAFHGMGTLFRRGTRAMNELVVAHLVEDVKEDHFRLFLKTLHRSGLTARADVVLIFHGSSTFGNAIREENDLFFKLVRNYKELKGASRNSSFDLAQFVMNEKKEIGEPLWGKRIRSNYSEVGEEEDEFTGLSYGSVVGFEPGELDPENSLSGFLDHVPMSLRRWACYPMLLGRVRRNFKHVMLVDVKRSVILGDPFVRVRNRSPESVYITTKQESKHRNSDKTQSHSHVNPAILMGGTRGIRRLSNAMLTEIVRAAMQRKKKNPVSESGVLSQLISNDFILKDVVSLIKPTESIPEASSLTGLSGRALSDYPIIQSGNAYNDINYIIRKLICSCEVDASVYRDC
ncbi:hypothetical protein HS088_TW03G00555 [Tripterygium wilfordii]|uniref:DUF7780 domain-containing protein n=1 Tax=Tripterygium wilfordii TaxID=458696 RepID=A0A7J7DV27_TRIWF|nr:uncharacterized protein LOC119988060 [Tripterygium wilfordii]KAF5750222.1 hypothetical protein HS088_TW03G00555 [Tripterygium wilfordii]